MARKRSGPWYWSQRKGWYATIKKRRYRLIDGPDDQEHAALAARRYETIKNPPPAPKLSADEFDDLMVLGAVRELVQTIRWREVRTRIENGTLDAAVREWLGPAFDHAPQSPVPDVLECRTGAVATNLLSDKYGLRGDVIRTLRMFSRAYGR